MQASDLGSDELADIFLVLFRNDVDAEKRIIADMQRLEGSC